MFGGHPSGDAILSTREMLQIGIVTLCMIIAHWSLRDISIEAAGRTSSALGCHRGVGGHGLRHHS